MRLKNDKHLDGLPADIFPYQFESEEISVLL